MKSHQKLFAWWWLAAAIMGLGDVLLIAQDPTDLKVEGKHLSKWFEQLESDERNTENVPVSWEAEGVLQRLKPDAIPFLLARLRYDPASDAALVGFGKEHSERRRAQAAAFLRIMGPPALSAVPALLEAWKTDPSKTVKMNCVFAMAWILEVKTSSYDFRNHKKGMAVPKEAYSSVESEVIASVLTTL